jgi:hypothetical protein
MPEEFIERAYEIPEAENNPYRLGRNVKHDIRSRQFPFSGPAMGDVPIEWDVVIGLLDQGPLGSCTGNAGTNDEAADNIMGEGYVKDPKTNHVLDEDYAVQLYSDATKIDPYSGTYPPTDTGSDGLTIAKVLVSRKLITKYEHIFSLDAAKAAITRGPFITGVNWYDGMFYPDSRGIVKISGSVAGGHEFLVRGRKQYFLDQGDTTWYWKCRNSWGNWADNGDFYLSDATYARLLSEDGDATVLYFVTRETPLVLPPCNWIQKLLRWLGLGLSDCL